MAGVLVRVPCDPLPFLEAGYGAAWDEPMLRVNFGMGKVGLEPPDFT